MRSHAVAAVSRVRGLWARAWSSLTVRSLMLVGTYALVVFLLITGFFAAAESYTKNVSADMRDVLAYRDELAMGRYDVLARSQFSRCKIALFDADSAVLYTSDSEFARSLGKDELSLIPGSEENGQYWLQEMSADDGRRNYLLSWVVFNDETGLTHVVGQAVLDENLQVVSGEHYQGHSSWTPSELRLILGIYDPDDYIEAEQEPDGADSVGDAERGDARTDGAEGQSRGTEPNDEADTARNAEPFVLVAQDSGNVDSILRGNQYVITKEYLSDGDGSASLLVFATPAVSEKEVKRQREHAQMIRSLSIPAIGVATILVFVGEWCLIRMSARGVAQVIEGYALGSNRVSSSSKASDETSDSVETADVIASKKSVRVPTELQPVLESFDTLTNRLEAEQDVRRRLISDVSHDLKTPFTVIRGYAQAFRDGAVPEGSEAACFDAICSKIDVAARMVESLSTYASMDHPEFRAELQIVNLPEYLTEMVPTFANDTEVHGCIFETDIAEGPLCARIDRNLLHRTLFNLVANAYLHNEPGTHVQLTCTAGNDGFAHLCVRDTGRGISPDIIAHIFEPFVIADEARATRSGCGLGLSIVRTSVELMGGIVTLHGRAAEDAPSSPWSCEFEVALPLV